MGQAAGGPPAYGEELYGDGSYAEAPYGEVSYGEGPARGEVPGGAAPFGEPAGRRGRGPEGPAGLFDEHRFQWPELPGDPVKEAKLPWTWFIDAGEARAYLLLFGAVNLLWVGLVISLSILHSRLLWGVLLVPATVVWLAYQRIWIGLCQRARPPMPRRQWFMGSWMNPRVRHFVRMARDVMADR